MIGAAADVDVDVDDDVDVVVDVDVDLDLDDDVDVDLDADVKTDVDIEETGHDPSLLAFEPELPPHNGLAPLKATFSGPFGSTYPLGIVCSPLGPMILLVRG